MESKLLPMKWKHISINSYNLSKVIEAYIILFKYQIYKGEWQLDSGKIRFGCNLSCPNDCNGEKAEYYTTNTKGNDVWKRLKEKTNINCVKDFWS